MKKATIIILSALILTTFLLTSCQKAKETESKKEVQVQQAQKEEGKQQPLEKGQTKTTIKSKQPSQEIKQEKPARCKEIWDKMPDFSKEEKDYLWKVCRIPWASVLSHN